MCAVVVLLSCINVSYTCPSAWICDNIAVDCQYANLTAITSEMPSGISNTIEAM
jgi:hypothetical protein